jgi:hypothetical protein
MTCGGLSDDLHLPRKVRYVGKEVPSVRLMYGEVPMDGQVRSGINGWMEGWMLRVPVTRFGSCGTGREGLKRGWVIRIGVLILSGMLDYGGL